MKGKPVTQEDKLALRRKHRKRRLWVYGSLFVGFFGFWSWLPYEFDIIPRTPPKPNPPLNPERDRLFAPGTKVLIVTAHPDDSEFFVGGLLTQLSKTAEIRQVICTDGDKGYYGPFTNVAENRRLRRAEAIEANRQWGGKGVEFLGHPDGRLRANEQVTGELSRAIESFRPDYVLAFDGVYPARFSHQDHRRAGDAALAAAQQTKIPKWCLLFSTIAPNFAVDITDLWDRKKELLAIHKSQWTGERFERVSNMVAGMAEADGELFDFSLAEGLRCVQIRQ